MIRPAETVENEFACQAPFSVTQWRVRSHACIYFEAKGNIPDWYGIPLLYHIIKDFPKERTDYS